MEGQRLLQDIKQLKVVGGLVEGVRVSLITFRAADLVPCTKIPTRTRHVCISPELPQPPAEPPSQATLPCCH